MRLNSVMSLVDMIHGYSEVEKISSLLESANNFGTLHSNNVFCILFTNALNYGKLVKSSVSSSIF
jgi:hypothetical protein